MHTQRLFHKALLYQYAVFKVEKVGIMPKPEQIPAVHHIYEGKYVFFVAIDLTR